MATTLTLDSTGKAVADLHESLRTLGYDVGRKERGARRFGESTADALRAFQQRHGLTASGKLTQATARELRTAVESSTAAASARAGDPNVPPDGSLYVVTGTVSCEGSAAVNGLAVRLVDKNIGGDVELASGETDPNGRYEMRAELPPGLLEERRKSQPDLQAQVMSAEAIVAASTVAYNASTAENLDIRLPADTRLLSEYETLTAAIGLLYPGSLAGLQESAERQDLTFLANKSGWDARAVAMACLAEQFSQNEPSQPGAPSGAAPTPPGLYYALFRAGLAANAQTLYRTSEGVLLRIWKQAFEQNVIPVSLESAFKGAIVAFGSIASAGALTAPPSVGPSTLWAQAATLGGAAVARLQLDGQLAALTVNNAPLISAIHGAAGGNGLASIGDLVSLDLHKESEWTNLLGGVDVPAGIPGSSDAERTQAYAGLLAAQVRLSFPTAVVGALVHDDDVHVSDDANAQSAVAEFLATVPSDFDIGAEPVARYVMRTGTTVAPEVVDHVTRIQRVYQMTPDAHALGVLLSKGIDSAYAVTRSSHDAFVANHASDLGDPELASSIYAQARAIHASTLSLTLAYMRARQAPALGSADTGLLVDPLAGSGPAAGAQPARAARAKAKGGKAPRAKSAGTRTARSNAPKAAAPAATAALVPQATLEKLFGDLDYCGCNECQSIIGPAAYLVDLLDYVDIDLPSPAQNPQSLLFARRPDIGALPLTCDNTNVALPYIDLVNETLEYFVSSNSSLLGYGGYNVDDTMSSAQLLAAPRFDDTPAATATYDTLRTKAWGPSPLPFERSLERLRRYLQLVGLDLHDVLRRLNNSLRLATGAIPTPPVYGWREVLIERIGLSESEYRLLTDSSLQLADIYGLPTLSTDEVIQNLSQMQAYSRKAGVSYDELVSMLETTFVNPDKWLIPLLEALSLSLSELADVQATGAITLPAGLDTTRYGGDVVAWVKANWKSITGLITITVTGEPCDTTKMMLQYADPAKATPLASIDFVRIQRFTRLWRKLGLSISQSDSLIAALWPSKATGANAPATPEQDLDQRFKALLPRIGFAYEVMDLLGLDPAEDLESLLSCWSPISTAGTDALFARMFSNPTLLDDDPAFHPDPLTGDFFAAGAKILDHLPALGAAMNLTATDLELITGVAPLGLAYTNTTLLTLDKLSAVYRRGWLARALGISVSELLHLEVATGIDPFTPLDLTDANPADQPLVRFVHLVQDLSNAGIDITSALYLIWNDDSTGKSTPPDTTLATLAQQLRQAIAAVAAQFVFQDDPTGTFAKNLTTLVLGAQAANFFFGLLTGTVTTSVPYSAPAAIGALPAAVITAGGGRLSYDDFAKQLTFAGLLDPATLQKLNNAATAAAATNPDLAAAINSLAAASDATVTPFFASYSDPSLDLNALGVAFVTSTKSASQRYDALLQGLLVGLRLLRKQQQAVSTVAAAAGCEPKLAAALLDNAAVMSAASGGASAIGDLTAFETTGLDVSYFYNNQPVAPADLTGIVPALTYDETNPLPAKAKTGAIAAKWAGYLCAPEDGDYRIAITTDTTAPADVELLLDGGVVALDSSGKTFTNHSVVSLKAGAFVAIELTVKGITSTLSVSWQTASQGRQPIPGSALYARSLVDNLRNSYFRFLRVATLAGALSLSATDLTYLAGISGPSWIDALTVTAAPSPAAKLVLTDALEELLAFARLDAKYSPVKLKNTTAMLSLVDVLTQMRAKQPDSTTALLALTGWNATSFGALLARLFAVANPAQIPDPEHANQDLRALDVFRRLDDAYELVAKSGLSADTLIAAANHSPDTPASTAVAALAAAVRARHSPADWLTVVKPLNDTMRELQRDALVSYILANNSADILGALGMDPTSRSCTADDLFNFFLMDVEMDPCMETSRVRHALSSVQLFIERCIRNLEPSVDPRTIPADEWAWRKRYRVWQANREVFLWPENWMDEALRDDQSPFFKTALKQLLQSDISQDTAVSAYLDYLSGLEQVAKLEPCGIFCEAATPGKDNAVAHVVARTAGAHRKHYYRKLSGGSWTPWEEIKLDIEGVPVTPYVWNGRLLLFWVQIHHATPVDPTKLAAGLPTSPKDKNGNVEKLTDMGLTDISQQVATAATGAGGPTQSKIGAVLCFSEYYNGKWQAPKTSDVDHPLPLITANFNAFDRTSVAIRPWTVKDDAALYVQVCLPSPTLPNSGDTNLPDGTTATALRTEDWQKDSAGFVLHNTHSVPLQWSQVAARALMLPSKVRVFETESNGTALDVAYGVTASPPSYSNFDGLDSPITVLTGEIPFAIVEAQPNVDNQWDVPFFFSDARNAFYVKPREVAAPIPAHAGYVVNRPPTTERNLEIKGLVVQFLPPRPSPDPYEITASLGDAALAERTLENFDNMRVALSASKTIDFNGTQIGFAGGEAGI